MIFFENFSAKVCNFRNIAYLCNPVRKQDDSQVLYDSKNVGNNGKWRDSLAQLVEHNTFNVGVSGSSPERITKKFCFLSSVGRARHS